MIRPSLVWVFLGGHQNRLSALSVKSVRKHHPFLAVLPQQKKDARKAQDRTHDTSFAPPRLATRCQMSKQVNWYINSSNSVRPMYVAVKKAVSKKIGYKKESVPFIVGKRLCENVFQFHCIRRHSVGGSFHFICDQPTQLHFARTGGWLATTFHALLTEWSN